MFIKEIAEVLGYSVTNQHSAERLQKIQRRVTKSPTDAGFAEEVEAADAAVKQQGTSAFASFVGAVTAPPREREYKIKRVAKGQRIKVVSASGVRFSFGPTWCDAIQACKGIVLNEANREKLNMHGTHVGVDAPESMSARELCVAIAAKM